MRRDQFVGGEFLAADLSPLRELSQALPTSRAPKLSSLYEMLVPPAGSAEACGYAR